MATIGVRTPLFERDPRDASRVRFGTADDRNRSASFQLATQLQAGSLHYGKLVMTGFWPRARFPARMKCRNVSQVSERKECDVVGCRGVLLLCGCWGGAGPEWRGRRMTGRRRKSSSR